METSCRKKYKPSSKKWILASRCAGLRRNSALVPANAGLFHYAGNNPIRYIDPDGRFIKKQFFSSGIEMLGGVTEFISGWYTSNVYSMIHSSYNFADGLIGVVTACFDVEWDGTTSVLTKAILSNTNIPIEVKDMIVVAIDCIDIYVSDVCSSNLPDVGKMGVLTGNLAKLWNSINNLACTYADVDNLDSNLEVVQNFIMYLYSIRQQEQKNDD